jgi:parallel beta-helix repeat protein
LKVPAGFLALLIVALMLSSGVIGCFHSVVTTGSADAEETSPGSWQVYYERKDESAYRFNLCEEVSGLEVWLYIQTSPEDYLGYQDDWIRFMLVGKPVEVASSQGFSTVEPIVGFTKIGYRDDGEKSVGGLHAAYYILPKRSYVSYINITVHAPFGSPRLDPSKSYVKAWDPNLDIVQLVAWNLGWYNFNVTRDGRGCTALASFGFPVGDQPSESGLTFSFGKVFTPPRILWKPDVYVEVGYAGGINIAPESFVGTGNYSCKIDVGIGSGISLNEAVASGIGQTVYNVRRGGGPILPAEEAASGLTDVLLEIGGRILDSPMAKTILEALGYVLFVYDLADIIASIGFDETVAESKILVFKSVEVGAERFFAWFNFFAQIKSAGLSGGVVNFWGKFPFGSSIFDNYGVSVTDLPDGGMQIGGILLDYYDPSPRSEEVVIQLDGTVSPFTAPIKSYDLITYRLEECLNVPLISWRSNIVLDGGNNTAPALILCNVHNSTVKSFEVGELKVSGTNCFIYGVRATQVRAVCINTTFENLHVEGGCLELSGMRNKVYRSSIEDIEYIHLHFLEDSLIRENIIANCDTGIQLHCSWKNVIERNYISNCSVGVELLGTTTTGNEIVENTFSNCVTAVSSLDAEGNLIVGNIIVGGSRILALLDVVSPPPSAIYIQGASADTISKNLITAYPRGLTLLYSNRVKVSANTIRRCNEGIHIDGSNNCILLENNLLNNTCDIYLGYAYNNTLFHNNFLGSNAAVIDGECTLDSGYPQGGNYWSSYIGVDEKSGVNQDLPGGDGIGDKPHIVSGRVADRYPLMEPYGELPRLTSDYTVHGGYVIQLTSNSIVSNFKYTPESHTISFHVEWRKGSRGFIDIRIPKDMGSGQLEVLFDGRPIPFDKSESEDFIDVKFMYEHSKHEVVIRFKQEETMFKQAYPYMIIVFGVVAVLLLILAVFIRKRRAAGIYAIFIKVRMRFYCGFSMDCKAIGRIAFVVLLTVVVASGSVAFYLFTGIGRGGQGSASGTMPSTPSNLYVSTVEIDRYLYEDEGLYMRLKIRGEVDVRDRVEINGVYGWWFGRVTVVLPDGSQAQLLQPEDHTSFFTQFLQIPGTLIVDISLPWDWYEHHCLEGAYNVTIWLKGPYENYAVLYKKVFNLKMALTAAASPTTWKSWDENVTITVANRGDIPLIVRGVGMEISRTGTVIGWIYTPTLEQRILVVMPGETKTWIGTPTIAGDFKENLSGKTLQVDFVLDIAGAPRRFAATANISFP